MSWWTRSRRSTVPVAATEATQPGAELGFHGSTIWDGLVQEDYNPDLRHPQSIAIYDKMRKSSAQVQAVESVIGLPIRTVRWYVEPAGSAASDIEAADLVERNLLHGDWMSSTFDDLIRKALISTMVGFALFETVWDEQDGYLVYRKFADRHPRTVSKWLFDENGGCAGFVQEGYVNGALKRVSIPIDRLLRFTHREEFGNPEGFALCRVMYKNWYIIDSLYRIANIGSERLFVGTPVGKYPPNSTDKDRDALLDLLKSIRAHEGAAVALPDSYSLETFGGNASVDALMALIDHHDNAMAKAALAGFVNLVGQANGSRALSSDQSQFFLLADQATAMWICSIINQYAVKRLCDANFPGIRKYPRLDHSHLQTVINPVAIGHALAALVNKQLVTPDDDVENAVRDMMNLPDIPDGQRRSGRPEPDQDTLDRDADRDRTDNRDAGAGAVAPCSSLILENACGLEQERGAGGVRRPAVTAADLTRSALRMGLSAIRTSLDESAIRLQTRGREIHERQLAALEKSLAPLVEQSLTGKPSDRARAYRAMSSVSVSLVSQYSAWLSELLQSTAKAGMDSAGRDGSLPVDIQAYCDAQALALASKHAEELRFAAVMQAQRDIDARLGRDQVMYNLRIAGRDAAATALRGDIEDAIRGIADQLSAAIAGP
jgi:hypothetical protein